ncbi:aldose 1-epimerase [Roseobacter cerasinus]|uniref:Aldose 1-epimerase n=1 Tax=Roseobacter cerasinus TaxID=2602289 RepID=A0A640VUM9_9RHOB|nr:aldose epimerase family protein [Roseobacter cerasinus]GFE50801.1 aldose 1-epimerase [Roseobacter cerasinus]
MQKETFGALQGEPVEAVRLRGGGLEARLITYGARLTELWVPDAKGDLADVVLGYGNLDGYVQSGAFAGATCGQYANRVAGGRCMIAGKPLQLDRNEGGNHLHGGTAGFDRKLWHIAALEEHSVTFVASTGDGEMGFPGHSNLCVRYSLTGTGMLEIEMTADTDAPTLINMAHHSYFNLSGQGGDDVLDHQLQIAAPFYTPVDGENLATGEIVAVAETPFDFQELKPIGRDIGTLGGGYDHNWCLTGATPAACLFDPISGRRMTLDTNQLGLQVYTGGGFDGTERGKAGQPLGRFAGVALETQVFPCSPNFAHFPNCILQPGEIYRHDMRLTFTANLPV